MGDNESHVHRPIALDSDNNRHVDRGPHIDAFLSQVQRLLTVSSSLAARYRGKKQIAYELATARQSVHPFSSFCLSRSEREVSTQCGRWLRETSESAHRNTD
jgi:hypothetical protein